MPFKSRLLTLLLAACAFLLPFAHARAESPYEIVVEDPWGRSLPSFDHRGELFVLGTSGQRYSLRVQNHTGRRVEAVITVDGRDVLSGRPGDYVRQRGYIIEPYGSVRVEGFRQSLEAVAAFRFSAKEEAYSSLMGTPENVGIIGAAFFPEARRRRPPPIAIPRRPRAESSAGAAPARSADARGLAGEAKSKRSRSASPQAPSSAAEASLDDEASNIGTEYGESRSSRVREVTFRRADATQPARVIAVRYDDRAGLEARGILPRPPLPRKHPPRAFPVSQRFAPPPPRYAP